MVRSVVMLLISFSLPLFAEFGASDYSEAMRMAVKFFGGQRCGNTHNWMLVESTDPNTTDSCHTRDSYNGHDVTGGWHDCGDHIKVAVTMGYAAICLLSAYDIWPSAFEDDHDQNYEPGENGIEDVLEEVKVATDYFMKCLIDGNTFVYYVGNSTDHVCWVTSSFQSTLGADKGGDPRSVTATQSAGGAQAADYASALALMAMNYPDDDYAQECRESAIAYYEFAKKYQSNINIPEFYSSPNPEISDEYALAGILMYRLTGDSTYRTDAVAALSGKWESNSALAWDTKADIAYYYLVKDNPAVNNGERSGTCRKFLRRNISAAVKGVNSWGIPWGFFKNNWGTNKLACGSAYPAALYAKLVEDEVIPEDDSLPLETANEFNRKIIDYMLGGNEFGHPFLHGYKGDMTHKVHHRNAMGKNELNFDANAKNSASFMFKSGALIGGPMSQGQFQNIVEGGNAFMETESGCDYNGPFVAALANIVAKLDPKVSAKPKPSGKRGVQPSASCHIANGRIQLNGISARRLTLCRIDGSVVASVQPGAALSVSRGVYFVRADGVRPMRLIVAR